MAVIHDLRAEDGEQLRLEVLLPEVLVLLGQVVKIHLAPAALRQCFQRLCVVFIALLLQLCRFGHDGSQLFRRGHVGLVFPLDLFALFLFQIGALLQRTHAHHKKLVQIGAVDRKKFDPLCKRNIFIFAQRKNAPVEIQPAQFPVDKNGIVTHNHSPFCCAGPPLRLSSRLPFLPRNPQWSVSGPEHWLHLLPVQTGHSASGNPESSVRAFPLRPAVCTAQRDRQCSDPPAHTVPARSYPAGPAIRQPAAARQSQKASTVHKTTAASDSARKSFSFFCRTQKMRFSHCT